MTVADAPVDAPLDAPVLVAALDDAARQGTGCLFVSDAAATRSGRVFFRDGKIYSVHVHGFMPKVGLRLHTGGMLTDDQYTQLLDQVGGDVYAPNLGALAVESDFIPEDALAAVLQEILLSSVGAMFGWADPVTKFKRGAATEEFTIPARKVSSIVKAVAKRRSRWNELWEGIAPGLAPEHAYPVAVTVLAEDAEPVSREVAAVLAASTGMQSLDAVAGQCGLTRFETGHVLGQLVAKGEVAIQPEPNDTATATSPEQGSTAEAALTTLTDEQHPDGGEASEAAHEPAPEPFAEPVEMPDAAAKPEPEPEAEPSTFGAADDTLPDGMDLGSLPTEQIANDTAPSLTAPEVPVHEDATAYPSPPLPLPVQDPHAHTPAPIPPVPADLPQFAEPVLPVPPAPDEVPAVSVDPAGFVAPAPAPLSVERFVAPPVVVPVDGPVDAGADAAVEQPMPFVEAAAVDGMPGVPLPPLPEFVAPPVEPTAAPTAAPTQPEVQPEVQPEAQPEIQPEGQNHVQEQTEECAELLPALPVDGPVETEPLDAAGHDDTGAPSAPPAAAEAEATVADESAAVDEDTIEDERTAATRKRVEAELAAAEEVATAAANALARAEADYESHSTAVAQIGETVDRFAQFLSDAETDQSRLQAESESLAEEQAAAVAERDQVESAAEAAFGEVATATEKVEAAREALRQAQAALTEAEEDLFAARDRETEMTQRVEAARKRVDDAEEHANVVAADLVEAGERVESYAREIAEVTEMAQSLTDAQEQASALKEAARQRLENAQRSLAAKQDRLAQLG